MNTTGIFQCHVHEIKVKSISDVITIVPFGDIHRFAPLCNEERWFESLERMKSLDKRTTYFLGMGDYDDLISASERAIFANPKIHESTKQTLDDFANAKTYELAKELDFMRGRIIGMLGGNHYYEFPSGMTSDHKLCEHLDNTYLGVSAVVRVTFVYGNKMLSLDIWAHHGKGASRLIGGSINRVEQMREAVQADVYCVDDKTEILTDLGWISQDRAYDASYVYAVDMLDMSAHCVEVNSVVREMHAGKMYGMRSQNVDMLLSPNHRVVYKNQKSDWLVKSAEKFKGHRGQVKIPLAVHTHGSFEPDDAMVSLTGWLISEGCFKHNSGILIYQRPGARADEIRRTLNACGAEFGEWLRVDGMCVFYIHKSFADHIRKDWLDSKSLPDWVNSLSDRQFDLFWNAMVKGDGSFTGPNSGTYYSVDLSLMDDLQAALALHGYRTRLYHKASGFKNGTWVLNWCKRDQCEIPLTKRPVTKIDYGGYVWCLNNRLKTMICRRGGYVFVTGNCMGHDHQRAAVPVQVLIPTLTKCGKFDVRPHTQWLCRTGSFLNAYEKGQSSYIADSARGPVSQGHIELEVGLRRDEKSKTTRGKRKIVHDRMWLEVKARI